MENNIIVVEQLPVITDRLKAVQASIQQRVSEALSLVCTEENYKDIKKVRAELNKEYQQLEARRKEVKEQVMAPYKEFEAVYKECAGDLYTQADKELAGRIAEVENGLKAEKETVLAAYFEQIKHTDGIEQDFVTLDRAGIKVGMSDSITSLKKKAAEFIYRVRTDLEAINQSEDRDELTTEYAKTLNLAAAISTVAERHKAIEAQKQLREQQEVIRAAQLEMMRNSNPEPAPAPVVPADIPDDIPEDIPEAKPTTKVWTFRFIGTEENALMVKKLIEKCGFQVSMN